jgi:hypothetical protein
MVFSRAFEMPRPLNRWRLLVAAALLSGATLTGCPDDEDGD